MTETLCNSGSVKIKAGENYDTDLTAANFTTFINQAEGLLSGYARADLVALFSGLGSTWQNLLEDGASSKAAFEVIKYNPGALGNIQKATNMMNLNWAIFAEVKRLLEDDKVRTAMGIT